MQSELERNQPFASVVVRVSKFDVYEVPVRFALIAGPSRSGPNPDTDPLRSPRAAMPVRSTRFAAYRTNACPSLKLDRCNDEPVFHTDSYGCRPGRSAIDAVSQARQRCWRYD